MTMTVQPIPLSKLVAGRAHTRRTGALISIDELAASIAAHGLLQNLQVRVADNDKFSVVAGRRRLVALKRLAKAKMISRSVEIPCHVLDGEDDIEISLAENIMRLPLHPADQYEAFKAIADQGKGPEEIAARFGCSPVTVKQRLKLGSIAPSLLEAYRNDEIELDQLMALAVTDDHVAQKKVWADLPAWNRHPTTIRRLLTQAHVEASDRRAQFVGIDTYVAAGGHVMRDLFEPEHQGYLTDPVLLDRLATEKLEREAEAVRTEGWKWLEIMPDLDYDQLRRMRRVYPERLPLSDEQQAEIDRLTQDYDALVAEHGDDPSETVATELERLSAQIDALSERALRWSPEEIDRAGAVIGIGHAGRLSVERGLVRREDEVIAAPSATSDPVERDAERSSEPAEKVQMLPEGLTENLTAHRTAALRAVLGGNADVALCAVVHALALPVFYPYGGQSCLDIRIDSIELRGSADGIEDSPAARLQAQRHAIWTERLPHDAEALWPWMQSQDIQTRLDLLAHCAACTVNAVRKPRERDHNERLAQADALAGTLNLDMTQWWQATGSSYLRHVTKARILEAVAEGVSPEAADNLGKLKKEALVAQAEERLAGMGWLPSPLRSPIAIVADTPEQMAAE
jgi:ParB family transcriptional regulator, chromosome partitioning protein